MDPQQHQTFGSYLQIHELDSFVGNFVYIWSDSFEANLHEAEQVSTPSTVSPSQLHYKQNPAVAGNKETNIFYSIPSYPHKLRSSCLHHRKETDVAEQARKYYPKISISQLHHQQKCDQSSTKEAEFVKQAEKAYYVVQTKGPVELGEDCGFPRPSKENSMNKLK